VSNKVLIVDDHELIRMSMAAALTATGQVEIAGECADGQAAIELARSLRPTVMLMDISMPVLDGLAATERILLEQPGMKVVIMTVAAGGDQRAAAMAAGAVSFVRKGEGIDVVVKAVLDAVNGC
jgi:DNA-binding NarL/FixJ family response regulator